MKYRLLKEINGFEETETKGKYIVSINKDNCIHIYEDVSDEVINFIECKGQEDLKRALEKTEANRVYVVEKRNDKLCIREHYGIVNADLVNNSLIVSVRREDAEAFIASYR